MKSEILVVAAHPDDEVLGMGGSIAWHIDRGDRVHVLFLSDGVGSRGEAGVQQRTDRQSSAREALSILGAGLVAFEDYPDNQFDTVPLLHIVQTIEAVKNEVQPSLVYTHHGGDLNVDHRIACQAVLTAFRPQPNECCVEIRTFEVSSATEWASAKLAGPFMPETFIDITGYLPLLEKALQCYSQELRDDPHARSLNAQVIAAKKRGREVGVEAAEAFMTLRRIIR